MNLKATLALLSAVLLVTAPAVADWNVGDGHKMHFPQLPDPTGWDVNITSPAVVADDFLCTQSGPISDIHFWASWWGDDAGQIVKIHASIHKDVREPGLPSRPEIVPEWEQDFDPSQFVVRPWGGPSPQGWYDPASGQFDPTNHQQTIQVNIPQIDAPFIQQRGTIYWLDLSVIVEPGPGTAAPARLGWKTSLEHWEDDAAWGLIDPPLTSPTGWQEVIDPVTGVSLDMAFVITPEPATMTLLLVGGLALARRRRRT